MKKTIEVLAPAGSYETMRAVMNAGSDAVYIGGSKFGARAYADNLDEEILLRAIDEAHIRGKSLYLTVNTLVKEDEMKDRLYNFLAPFYREGLDAVIVQDVGAMNFIHRNFPLLEIHASTQTTITMAQGANLLKESGVTRIVTARELSIKEIKAIRVNTDLEIETFVHGALCYCYSGQCLMSSIIGGRSGNRGRCAQPCRMPYQFVAGGKQISTEQDKYLLSPKDINTLSLIPELIEAGVDSFKIEGRMKRPEYSAGVAAIYRACIDRYLETGKEGYQNYLKGIEHEKNMRDLLDLYNRGGFSEGYGKTYHGKSMMSLRRPNHSGVYVGDVSALKGSQATINLIEDIYPQDILEIRDKQGEKIYEFTVKDALSKGSPLRANTGRPSGGKDKGKYAAVQSGYQVYRTRNNDLLNRLASAYIASDVKQEIKGTLRAKLDEPLTLTLGYGDVQATASQGVVVAAQKQPMTRDKLIGPIMKLGDTAYTLVDLTLDMDQAIFVPVAWLNDVRRAAVNLLQEAVLDQYRRELSGDEGSKVFPQEEKEQINSGEKKEKTLQMEGYSLSEKMSQGQVEQKVKYSYPKIVVTIQTSEQFTVASGFDGISSIYGDYHYFSREEILAMAKKSAEQGIRFYLMLPQICRLSVYKKLKEDIAILYGENDIKGFVVRNFEEVELLKGFEEGASEKKELILNHNMYIFNKEAKEFWRKKGIHRYTAPLELNSRELRSLGLAEGDLMVYGSLPLMVSVQCLYESTEGCKRCKAGEMRRDHLVDRMGMKFYVQTNCKGCYNIIYNGKCLSLLKYAEEVQALQPEGIRLDFVYENGKEVREVLEAFKTVYLDHSKTDLNLEDTTAGHFKRGVE